MNMWFKLPLLIVFTCNYIFNSCCQEPPPPPPISPSGGTIVPPPSDGLPPFSQPTKGPTPLTPSQVFARQDNQGNSTPVNAYNKFSLPYAANKGSSKSGMSYVRTKTGINHPPAAQLFPDDANLSGLLNSFLTTIENDTYFLVYFSQLQLLVLHQLYMYLTKIYTVLNLTHIVTETGSGTSAIILPQETIVWDYVDNEATQALNKKTLIINHLIGLIEAQMNQAILARFPGLPKNIATYAGSVLMKHDYGADLTVLLEGQEETLFQDLGYQKGKPVGGWLFIPPGQDTSPYTTPPPEDAPPQPQITSHQGWVWVNTDTVPQGYLVAPPPGTPNPPPKPTKPPADSHASPNGQYLWKNYTADGTWVWATAVQMQTYYKTQVASIRNNYISFFSQYLAFFRQYTGALDTASKTRPYAGITRFVDHAEHIGTIIQKATHHPKFDPTSPTFAAVLRSIQTLNPPLFFYDNVTLRGLTLLPKLARSLPKKSQKVPWPQKIVTAAQQGTPLRTFVVSGSQGIIKTDSQGSPIPVAFFLDAKGNQIPAPTSQLGKYLFINILTAQDVYQQELLPQPDWLNTYEGVMTMLKACLGDFSVLLNPVLHKEDIIDPCVKCIIGSASIGAKIAPAGLDMTTTCSECKKFLHALRELLADKEPISGATPAGSPIGSPPLINPTVLPPVPPPTGQ